MVAAANLVEVTALVGDTARATMLNALMGGQSLTATELAYCANISRSTASGHLSKLVAARLLTVTRNRRFSYYRIASPLVATMLESLPPEYREVIVLREWQQMSYAEMASALGVPERTAETRLTRARRMLRQRFGGYA